MKQNDNITTYFWSRCPGKYVNCYTGTEINFRVKKKFVGSVKDWYNDLVETIDEILKLQHGKQIELKVSYEVMTIFQHTSHYDPNKKELKGIKVSLKKRSKNNIHQIEIYNRNRHIINLCVLDLCVL
jgi:hypothetical protein